MKLIFDQNLSPSLVKKLQDLFPNSTHVHLCGLGTTMDIKVWEYTKANGLNIVSKDADYPEISLTRGYPPKIVWIRRSNRSTIQIEKLIRRDIEYIRQLDSNPDLSIVSIGAEESPSVREAREVYRAHPIPKRGAGKKADVTKRKQKNKQK